MLSAIKDFGMGSFTGEVMGDANAALGIIKRHGIWENFDTTWLWVQYMAAQGGLQYNKVKGVDNMADLFTKALDIEYMMKHAKALGNEVIGDASEGGDRDERPGGS